MARDSSPTIEPFMPAALAASNVGTWDYDVANNVFRCDRVMAALYGFSVEESHRGMKIERVVTAVYPDDRVMHRSRLTHNVRYGGVFVLEYRVLPSPREIRWVLARGRYDADDKGRVVHGRGVVVDITESKQDGYADGSVFFMTGLDGEAATALDRAAKHVLAARQAIHELGSEGLPRLRPAIDEALVEIGRHIAGSIIPVTSNRTEH